MPSFSAQLAAFKTKTVTKLDTVTRLTIEEAGERIVMELSPVGDPTLWMRAPPASYTPGSFRSNWNYSVGAPDKTTSLATNITTLNGLGEMPAHPAGLKHYIANSLEYAQALEYGHSSQAPAGIVGIIEIELPGLAETAARKAAA